MKTFLKLFFTVFCFLWVASCSKDDDSPEPIVLSVNDFTATISENPVGAALELGTITAKTNRGELAFSLENQQPGGALQIAAKTGTLSVANAALFDFESNPTITATVVVTVEDEKATAEISITVTDIDETMITAEDFDLTIDENPDDGQSLGTLNATTNVGVLSYSITQQSPEGAMAIDAATGELTVANAGLFDYEINTTLTAEVEVATNTQSETVTVTITLNDVTEAAPGTIPFIFTWEVSAGQTMSLPSSGSYTYDYTVDWGDGNTGVRTANDPQIDHRYMSAGTYTVTVTGALPWAPFNGNVNRDAIRTIEQWGNIQWENMTRMFSQVQNITINATDAPDLSNVTDLSFMFERSGITNPDFSGWDTGNVTNMQRMFFRAGNFNGNLSGWDVAKVTTMEAMFANANSFNGDISNWNPENVTDMEFMFQDARAFNQDLGNWNVGSVTTTLSMFSGALSFNQGLNGWDVSAVTNMAGMFRNAAAFNQNLNNWDVSSVTNMGGMFTGATNFNGNVNNWNVSNVTSMASMFATGAGGFAKGQGMTSRFNQDISGWDVSNVTDMNSMFEANEDFNQNIGAWNVANVVNMRSMFEGASAFNQDIGDWNVAKVTDMRRMFYNAGAFNQNINDWDVSSVSDISGMFYNAISFDQPLNTWDVTGVSNFSFMFYNANSFNQDIGDWDVSNATVFGSMLANTSSFDQDLGSWQFTALAFSNSMQGFLDRSGMGTANYDLLLTSLAGQATAMPMGVNFGSIGLVYCSGATSRNTLINSFGWQFADTACIQ